MGMMHGFQRSAGERFYQALLIASLTALSWLGMMAVHELGHVLHAWTSGGKVVRVVLHPATFSRTDVSPNPRPLWVAWGGATWGSVIPLAAWMIARWFAPARLYLFAFFAGWGNIALPGTVPGAFSWYFWIPIVGPLIGGVIGVLIYDVFISDVLQARAGHEEPPGRTQDAEGAEPGAVR